MPAIKTNLVQKANPFANAPTKTASPFGPAGSALQNKISPTAPKTSSGISGLFGTKTANASTIPAPSVNINQAISSGGLTPTKTSGQLSGGSTSGLYPQAQNTGLSESQVKTNLTNYQNSNPAYQTGGNPNAAPNVIGQNIQSPQDPTQKPVTATPQDTLAQRGLYGQLIGQGLGKQQEAGEYAKQAGQLTQAMQRETRDVMGNPWYSGSVKVGQAANIAQQQGSQLQGLAAQQQALTGQGEAFNSAAGKVAPVNQFGVLTDPTSGQPVMGGTPQQAAFQGGQVGASLGLGGDYAKAQGFIAQGQTQVTALNDLIASSGVNVNDAPAVNNLLQEWSKLGQSDPRYQKLQSILQGLNASYSQVLGQAVDVQALASQSGKSIMDVVNDLNKRATASAEAIKQTGTGQPNTYQAPAPTSGTGTGGTWDW